VQRGVLYQLIAFVDRVTADLQAQRNDPLHLLLTGGDAARLQPLLGARWTLRPDLVLEGIAALARTARRRQARA
jgi:pantothenate kinase type III